MVAASCGMEEPALPCSTLSAHPSEASPRRWQPRPRQAWVDAAMPTRRRATPCTAAHGAQATAHELM
eukprot:2390741-Lingulodinium_polyedra.AAC.1